MIRYFKQITNVVQYNVCYFLIISNSECISLLLHTFRLNIIHFLKLNHQLTVAFIEGVFRETRVVQKI